MRYKKISSAQVKLIRQNIRIICTFVIFTAIFSFVFLVIYRNMNDELYSEIIEENLAMAHREQVSSTRSTIEEARRLMESVAILQAQEPENEPMPRRYLSIFDSLDNLYDVSYYSKTQLEMIVTFPECPAEDILTISRVLKGESLVSDVRISSRLNNVCDFTIAVPVIIDDKVTGAIFGQVKAEFLTKMAQFQEERITDNYLILGDGDLIYGEEAHLDDGYNIFTEMQMKGIPKQRIEEFHDVLNNKNGEHVVELTETPDGKVYLMVTPIGYNDWKLLSISYLQQAERYSSATMKNTAMIITLLFAVFTLILIIMVLSLNWMRKKTLERQASYELLAKFSDTILFYYDCMSEKLSYTPNVLNNYHMDRYENLHLFDKSYEFQALHPDDRALFRETIALMSKDQTEGDERISFRFKNRAGEYVWVSYDISQLRNKKNHVYAVVGKMSDIHDYKLHEQQLVETYSKDSLTHAYNRGSAEQMISETISKNDVGTFILLDVDNFKYINDHFGHAAGDDILKHVVGKVFEVFDKDHIVGRIGGDEFVIYMPECIDRDMVEQKVQALFALLPQMESYKTTVSVGIAFYPKCAKDFADLYRVADKAMYEAKKKGKNGYCFCEDEGFQM